VREEKTAYSAQLGFPDGTSEEFDVTEDTLHAPSSLPGLSVRLGRQRYSQGQWVLFDALCDGALKLVTARLGGAGGTKRVRRRRPAVSNGRSSKR